MEKYRKSVFVVVYRKTPNGIKYLILKRKLHWSGWEFPKGGINDNEEIMDAVKREIKEETGRSPLNVQSHNFYGKYKYDKKVLGRKFIGQTFSLYSAELKDDKIQIDEREHSDYLWPSYLEANKKLTYENQKKSLEIVNEALKKE
ncbi:NUDIX domain-containing protein [Candidatus Pacearchaeota archaeon]|nr:NUDIX domain-containing protein [Candidatus Pacearchaeota archaeon]MBI2057285.1 NUDIX domain-containing protein [Candidatus Pacearchaeota archaeon]